MIGNTTVLSIATRTEPNGSIHGRIAFVVSGARHSDITSPMIVPATNPMRMRATSGSRDSFMPFPFS